MRAAATAALLVLAALVAAAGPARARKNVIPWAPGSEIDMGFLLPEGYESMRAAAELGVELVNQLDGVLPDMTLVGHYKETREHHVGEVAVSVQELEAEGVAVVGGPADSLTSPISAFMLGREGINLINGYGRQNALSNRTEYPTVTRLFPSGEDEMAALLKMCASIGWHRISVIVAVDELAVEQLDSLVEEAPDFGVEIETVVQYPKEASNMTLYFDLLDEAEARVVVMLVPSAVVFDFYAALEDHNGLRPERQYIAPSLTWRGLAEYWRPPNFLDNTIYFGPMVNNDDSAANNLYGDRLARHLYNTSLADLGDVAVDYTQTQQTHDSALIAAHALDEFVTAKRRCNASADPDKDAECKRIAEEDDDDVTLTRLLHTTKLGFADNITGMPYVLTEAGRAVPYKSLQVRLLSEAPFIRILLNAVVDTDPVTFGHTYEAREGFDWRASGGVQPADRPAVETETVGVSDSAVNIVAGLAAVAVAAAVFYSVATLVYRRRVIMRMSSYRINIVSAVGGIVLLAPAFLQIGGLSDAVCQARVWCFALGFSLLFGPMLAKTFRVHRFYASSDVQQVTISDKELLGVVAAFCAVDAVLVGVWHAVGPLERSVEADGVHVPTDNPNLVTTEERESCSSDHSDEFTSILILYKGALLVIGSVLAYRVRRVRLKALNDSFWIGLIMYTTTILALVSVPVALVLSSEDQQDSAYVLAGVPAFLIVFVSLTLLFLPKLVAIWTGTESSWVSEDTRDVTCADTFADGAEMQTKPRANAPPDSPPGSYKGERADPGSVDPEGVILSGGAHAHAMASRSSSASTTTMAH